MRDNVAIAVVAPQEPFVFFSDFWEGVWTAAYELAPFGAQVNNILLESLGADRQAQALEELLEAGVDAVVLLPGDSQRFDNLIERFADRGTSVVTVFNDAPLSRRALFVGPDYRVAGRLAAEMLGNVIQPNGRIAVLAGSRDNAHHHQQYEGFLGTLLESGRPFSLMEFDTPEELLVAMNSGDLPFDGFYAGWSESVKLGEILERVQHPARGVAFGLTEITKPHLASGRLCAVIDSNLYYQGYLAVQKAYECAIARSIESRWVAIPSSVMLSAHANANGQTSSMHLLMEAVLQQRTRQVSDYKQELDLLNARLMRAAETDSLTGLLNQRKFEEYLEMRVEQSTDGASPVALLVIVLEDAAAIVSLLGQAALDGAVQAVAEALRAACRSEELLARTGPDEFSILLSETSAALVESLADQILESVSEARMAADPEFVFCVSIGLAWAPLHGRTAAELRRAAEAMPFERLRKAG